MMKEGHRHGQENSYFFIFSHGFIPVTMGLHPGLYSVGLSALFGDDPPSQFLSTARQAGALTTIASNHYSINLIITICRFEIKEMTTLFWNFELLQLISVAKIRYNRQNNTTKKIRVDSLDSW